jgi:hypothetical protein
MLTLGSHKQIFTNKKGRKFFISNFRRVLNIVCFLLGYSPASTLCLFHLHRPMKMEQTECSEKLVFKLQTSGNSPEESKRQGT